MFDKSLILSNIRNHLNFKSDTDFAKYLGINRNVLSNWRARNTYDVNLLIQKCDFLNVDYLLTGKEPMLKGETQTTNTQTEDVVVLKVKLELYEKIIKEKERTIGLLEDLVKRLENK